MGGCSVAEPLRSLRRGPARLMGTEGFRTIHAGAKARAGAMTAVCSAVMAEGQACLRVPVPKQVQHLALALLPLLLRSTAQ